jgi:hypothetical protein
MADSGKKDSWTEAGKIVKMGQALRLSQGNTID